jgi:hypothetical protein
MRWPWRRRGAIDLRRAVSKQGYGTEDGQGDPGGGLPRPAQRDGGDDPDAEEEEREGRRWLATFCLGD